MNFTRFFLGVVIGVLTSGIMLSISGYLISLYESSGSGNFINLSNIVVLGIVGGAILGGILGGISGAIIVGFQLNFIKTILFGFLFNFFISIILVFLTGEDPLQKDNILKYIIVALLISGLLNGVFVSLYTTSRKISE